MKKLIQLVVIFTTLFVVSTAHGSDHYTWDGEFSPAELSTWKVTERVHTAPGIVEEVIVNPDQTNDVKEAKVLIFYGQTGRGYLVAFKYKKGFIEYSFQLIGNHYKQVKPETS